MALDITYNWNFNPLESYPTSSGETDVVFLVHWQLYANTGSYGASAIGTQAIATLESGSTFIPFNELTKDIVCGWVTSSMASGSVEAMFELSELLRNGIGCEKNIDESNQWFNKFNQKKQLEPK